MGEPPRYRPLLSDASPLPGPGSRVSFGQLAASQIASASDARSEVCLSSCARRKSAIRGEVARDGLYL
jgi:hypothetical protein